MSENEHKKTNLNREEITLGSGNGLWDSVFQPGANKSLLICTHLSFVALIITLSSLVYISKYNIHYINLLVIAICLYVAVNWFIIELGRTNLMSNEELQQEATKKEQ
ncbi:hypothetical protein QEN19_000218 [Hanseniaspora menglaensis]